MLLTCAGRFAWPFVTQVRVGAFEQLCEFDSEPSASTTLAGKLLDCARSIGPLLPLRFALHFHILSENSALIPSTVQYGPEPFLCQNLTWHFVPIKRCQLLRLRLYASF